MGIPKLKITQFRKNVLSGFLAYGLNALVILVAYPLYIKYLGYELLGLWSTFAIVISVGQIGNIGVSETMMKFLAEESDHLKNNNLVYAYITNGFILILISSTILFSFVFLSKDLIISFLNITEEYQEIAQKLIAFIIFISFQQILISFLKGILAGIGRLDLSNTIFIVGNVFRVIAIYILFLLDMKIWAMVYGNILVSSLNIIVFYVIIAKRISNNIFRFSLINRSIFRRILSYGSGLLGSNVLSGIFIPIFKVLIARYIGLKEVAYFEISWKVVYQIRGLIQKSLLAYLPHISELNKKKQFDKILLLVRKSMIYSLVFSTVLMTGMLLFARFIIDIWLGENAEPIIAFGMKILTIGLAGGLIVVPIHYFFLGIGRVSVILYSEIIKFVFTIAALFALAELKLLTYNSFLILVVSGILLLSTFLYLKFLITKRALIKSTV